MSKVLQSIVENNLQKSVANYAESQLPTYTVEEINAEIQKGEKSFFTYSKIEEIRGELIKGEMSEEISKSVISQIQSLEKVVINKGDSFEYGFFLEKPKTEEK